MDGNAEGYILYHFVGMKGITCKSGELTLNIDISEFEDTEFAYGMFTSTRDQRQPTEKLGVNGQITQRKGFFTKDKYYAEISANPEKDHSATIRAFLSIIEKNLQGAGHAAGCVRMVPDGEPDGGLGSAGAGKRARASAAEKRVRRPVSGGQGLPRTRSLSGLCRTGLREAEGTLRPDDGRQDRRRCVHGH